ncbi:hypothetical protein AB0G95_21760 [Streptomyces virginiae]|uniref:hypothetical protein n=1 Tax=Streptomyces virginiae TaxID=1961 RepID=UPI0034368B16
MPTQIAVTCGTADCYGLILHPDPAPTVARAAAVRQGWQITTQGDRCPACIAGRQVGADDRGSCPRCGGRGHWHERGYVCTGCRHIIEPPDDGTAWPDGDDETPPADPSGTMAGGHTPTEGDTTWT